MSQPTQFPQLALLDRITEALRAMPQVRAAALRSRLSGNQPDAYAFVDLFVVAAEAEPEALLATGRKTVQAAGPVQWLSLLSPQPPRLRALVNGPFRIDVTVVTPTTVPVYTGWRVLLDHDNLLRERTRQGMQADTLRPEHVAELCDAFWWQLFSSVGQLKHGQLWQAHHQLNTCRDNLAQIMRWRRDPERPFEHYLNLEHYLTPEDQQALVQTLVGYDVRSIAAGLLHAADAFDPAAREVSARLGATYPAPLAQAAKEFFIREFWALIAPGPTISA